jgi:hypothetical protein
VTMSKEELQKIYGLRLHREISARTAISKDRVLNTLTAVLRLQVVVDEKDPRLISLQDLCGQLFFHIKTALELEEKIEVEVTILAQEVGRAP